jgi:hypothetical protein
MAKLRVRQNQLFWEHRLIFDLNYGLARKNCYLVLQQNPNYKRPFKLLLTFVGIDGKSVYPAGKFDNDRNVGIIRKCIDIINGETDIDDKFVSDVILLWTYFKNSYNNALNQDYSRIIRNIDWQNPYWRYNDDIEIMIDEVNVREKGTEYSFIAYLLGPNCYLYFNRKVIYESPQKINANIAIGREISDMVKSINYQFLTQLTNTSR